MSEVWRLPLHLVNRRVVVSFCRVNSSPTGGWSIIGPDHSAWPPIPGFASTMVARFATSNRCPVWLRRFSPLLTVGVVATLGTVGCCHPFALSHRWSPQGPPPGEPAACECGGIWEHAVHCAESPPILPGTELHAASLGSATEGPPTIQAPHSKFHPVPVRPVFAPR